MNEGGVGLMVVGAAPRRVPASMRPPRVPASMEGLDLEAAKAIAAAATAAMDRTREAKRQRVDWAGMLSSSYYEAMGQQIWPDEEREEEEGEEEEGEEEDCKLVEAEAAEAEYSDEGEEEWAESEEEEEEGGEEEWDEEEEDEGNCSCDGEAGELR